MPIAGAPRRAASARLARHETLSRPAGPKQPEGGRACMKRTLPVLACIAVVSALPGPALCGPRPKTAPCSDPSQPTSFRSLEPQRAAASAHASEPTGSPRPGSGRTGWPCRHRRRRREVVRIIAAGNEIATKPYKYGGGHGSWADSGYDCSGSVSYALHGAGLLDVAARLERTGRLRRGRPRPLGHRSWAIPGTPTWWWPDCASTPARASRAATAGRLRRAPRADMPYVIPPVSEVRGMGAHLPRWGMA